MSEDIHVLSPARRALQRPWIVVVLGGVMVASGCDDGSTGPRVDPPPALEMGGEFQGFWSVVVADTGVICGGFPATCGHPTRVRFQCPTTFGVSVTGDSSYVASVSIDAGACASSSPEGVPPDDTPYLSGLTSALSMGGSVHVLEEWEVPSGTSLYVQSELTPGAGTIADYRDFLGCMPFDEWRLSGDYAEIGTEIFGSVGQDPSHTSVLMGRITNRAWPTFEVMSRTFGDGELPAVCAGQVVVLYVEFVVGR